MSRHIPRRLVREVLERAGDVCEYCLLPQDSQEATFHVDHIVPRSQDGANSWENVVCCCLKCNVRKGGRTPVQAGMKLIKEPVKPRHNPALTIKVSDGRYASWRQFLDHAYWNVELK